MHEICSPSTSAALFLLITISIASAANLPNTRPSHNIIQPSSPDHLSPLDILPALDFSQATNQSTALLLNASVLNSDYDVTCDAQYGTDLNVDDCLEALTTFTRRSRDQITFANRYAAFLTPELYPLPWRWMGSKASCYIQPILKPGAETGTTSIYKIRDAASDLTTQCALRQGKGGIVNNLGGDNNLALIIGAYTPPVPTETSIQCRGVKDKRTACRRLINILPVTPQPQIFGPVTDARHEVEIPLTYSCTDEGECSVTVLTTNRDGKGDTTTWYKLWEAATAVYAKCVVKGFKGSHRGLGENGELFLNMLGP